MPKINPIEIKAATQKKRLELGEQVLARVGTENVQIKSTGNNVQIVPQKTDMASLKNLINALKELNIKRKNQNYRKIKPQNP